MAERTVVGWREWVELPELGVTGLKAKVDTGATTSALHASKLVSFERDGAEWVRFEIHPRQRSRTPSVTVELPVVDHRRVRSSSGETEVRPVVHTMLKIGDRVTPIDVTLTRRDSMGFRMLIGRRALRRRYLVNPSRSFLAGPPRNAFP